MRIPKRPDPTMEKLDAANMRWAMVVIGWSRHQVIERIHSNPGSFGQMRRGKRLIPDNLKEWLALLAEEHVQHWTPEPWPLTFPDLPQDGYTGAEMKRALDEIGWSQKDLALRLDLPYRIVGSMAAGIRLIPAPFATWLEDLAALHRAHQEPVGWRPKIPHDIWYANYLEEQRRKEAENVS